MRRLKDESGATAVLLALAMLPLIGVVALVIDIGLMQWEVRQLQNGADAAALAVAQECANGNVCQGAVADAMALQYTRANANDGNAAADVEFNVVGPNTVTVTASTLDEGGRPRLAYIVAPILGFDSGSFERSATALYGSISLDDALTLPITISECEWANATNLGVDFEQPYVFEIKTNPGVNQCTMPNSPGQYAPGGWGWLSPTGDGCEAIISLFGVPGQPGSGPPSPDCNANRFDYPSLLNTTVLIPIHGDDGGVSGSGAGTSYDMIGLGAFHITSYKLLGNIQGGPQTCPGTGQNQRCLIGYFERFVPLGDSVDPDLPELGVTAVQLIG